MDTFLELLKYILPALITFGATYFVLNKYLDNEYRKQLILMKKENQRETIHLRLQAYERLVLFLERSSLDKLVIRLHKPGMSAKLLHSHIITTINEEFNHNLTQQIYISSTTWSVIKKAKDETIKVVKMAGVQLKEGDNASDLGQKIFDIMGKLEASPSQIAIQQIKKEVRQLF